MRPELIVRFRNASTRTVRRAGAIACLAMFTASTMAASVIDYNYRSFALLDSPPRLAEMEAYKKLEFSPQVAESSSISATNGVDGYTCTLVFQDAATAVVKPPSVLPIVGFSGCPFDIPLIAAEQWVALRESIIIDIREVRDGVIYVSENSLVPFVAQAGRTPFPVPTALGVVWRFEGAGMRFTTAAGDFITARAGATISFNKSGVRFRGFSTSPTQGGLILASKGWSRDTMRSVQQRLTRLGYKPGPVDGLWGSRTRDALLAFQRSAGLDVNGVLDGRTLVELGI